MHIPDNTIKHISFIGTEYEYYSYPILTADDTDKILLDVAQTTSMIFNRSSQYNGKYWMDGRPMIQYPKWHRGDKYKLDVNEYFIKEYNDVRIRIYDHSLEKSIGHEGRKIEVIGNSNGEYDLDRVYPLLNFEGKSWQHFTQDCLPILVFGIDFLKENPDVDLLVYEPHTWKYETFFELMKYFDLDNKVIFIPHGFDCEFNVKTLYNFDATPTMPTWWWNTWFYEQIHSILPTSDINKNVILVERPNLRSLKNSDEIAQILMEYAYENSLNFIRFNPSDLKPDELFKIFSEAHTVVSPHGGANYNMIFCNSNTKFIELCFTDCMYSLYNIAASIKCKYYIIPASGHNNTQHFYLPSQKLKKIINE
jgi:hypothetical protein